MRRKLRNLKNKSGHSENGAPRSLLDEALYRERRANLSTTPNRKDSEYSGWSHATRPKDQAISLRSSGTPSTPSNHG